ncbi:bifunctional Helicase [Babesia duncani]|uniref:Bifunctional Helicase n=1 Tax=Babesia duncani TaxID=323732 RepID=A0AAD9PM09_9APIC|nr:bifunctional Helicase [Babesia duncani]
MDNDLPVKSGSMLHKLLTNRNYIRDILAQSKKDFRKGNAVSESRRNIRHGETIVEQPSILTGTAKGYQMDGLRWLVNLYDSGLNGILADEMGLGKTFQTISLMAYLKEHRGIDGLHLVLAPKSTIGNWIREINRFCPSLRALKFIGNKEERTMMISTELDPKKYDIIVTSYEICCKTKNVLSKLDWHYVIIDEAHRIKNDESKLSEVVRLFRTEYRLLITGTPLQNNLKELWALLNFLFPEVFASSEEFEETFDLVGPKDLSQEEREARNYKIIARLHDILRPFMLRRSKKDVLTGMPPKNELLLMVPLSKMQKQLYRDLLRKNVPDLGVEDSSKSGMHVQLLNLAMQLRKACNHPYLFEGYEDRDSDPFGEHLVENAGKLSLLDKLLYRLLKSNSRILIFSQMSRMLDILEDYCRMRGYLYFRIDGNTSGEERDSQIASFNVPDSEVSIFLLSTRAGGLGINLATADVVILYDSDWNPQVDLQAIDRAHRIGQLKPVHVYRLVHEYTIEEKIIERATLKLQLDSAVIQHGKLRQKELLAMVQYGASHIFKAGNEGITDADLDVILSKGQERANMLNDKLCANSKKGLLDFSQTATSSTDPTFYDSEDRQIWEELGQARNDPNNDNGIQDREGRRRNRMRDHSDMISAMNSRMVPQLILQEWQFYDPQSLCKQEHETEEEFEERRDQILADGFGHWSKRDFNAFVRANTAYSRYDLVSISKAMNKPLEEIQRYSEIFWTKYTTLSNWQKYIKKIEAGEEALLKRNELHQLVVEKQRQLTNPWVGNDYLFSAHRGKSPYSEDADRWLVNAIALFGYDVWDELSELLKLDPRLQHDVFFRGRSGSDLSKRADYIVKHLSKEKTINGEGEGGRSKRQREVRTHLS